MRKNFIFLAVLLVLISAMVFVACDDPGNSGNNPSNPTTDASAKLKEGMTLGEVKAVLYEAKNVTIEKRVNNVVEYSAKLSASGYSLSDSVKNTLESSFIEGNKLYRFYVNGDSVDCNVYDVTGYDLRFGADCAKIVKVYLEDLYAGMVENGFRIANNELSVTSVSDKGVVKVIVKDVDNTTLDVPQQYKDYKQLAATDTVLSYEDIDENSCKLTKVNVPLNSLVVEEKHNGKDVAEVDFEKKVVDVTIPNTVKSVRGLADDPKITFGGTKAEWNEIDLGAKFENAPYDVTCSDGEIKKGDKIEQTPDQPDQPEKPDQPDQPDKPDQPDNPDKPDNPDQPDKPDNPDKPDDPEYPGIKLPSDTTLSGLKAALQNVKSLTYESYDKSGKLEARMLASSKRLYVEFPQDKSWSAYLVENDVYYFFKALGKNVEYTVIDVKDFDVADFAAPKIKAALVEMYEKIGRYGMEIKDNSVIIENTYNDGDWSKVVFGNFDNTSAEIPYENYQNLKTNDTVLKFTDVDDTTCNTSLKVALNTLTIPSVFNDKTVVGVNFCYNVENVVMPNTVKSFSNLSEGSNINYKGTKEEWANVEYSYSNNKEPYNVTCTDAVIKKGDEKVMPTPTERTFTYNKYTSQMPSQWCDVTINDSTNQEFAKYFRSSLFEFNYKYDENGKIVPGGFAVEYSAATKLEDVTAKYAGQYGISANLTNGRAFAITLRDDLRWDDGTPIKAEDFVYSMQQQLSPKYLFDTAANYYYYGNLFVHNAEKYLKQGTGWFDARTTYGIYDESLDSKLVFAIGEGSTNTNYGNAQAYYFSAWGLPAGTTAEAAANYMVQDGGARTTVEAILALEGKTLAEIKADETMKATWEAVLGFWQTDPNEELDFFVTYYTYPEMDFSEVGYFVGDNEYELVIVLDNDTLNLLDENGDLTYEAANSFNDWPLVKRDLWERCEHSSGGVPYANSYGTSVETSASWGPYKLTDFKVNQTCTLSRNENWFGYGLKQYEGQYQTDTIVITKQDDWDTVWEAFQRGEFDGINLDLKIASDYRNSKRAIFKPETFTFSLNLQSKATSRTENRNNLLLNYKEFRNAISLALNRSDYCSVNAPTSEAALGLLNELYYYDVENGKTYRGSTQAKEAILNAYGATKNADGSWKVGTATYTDIDEALDATTGYNLTLARQLVDEAVSKAIAAGDYPQGEKVVLTYGIAEQTANTDRIKNWFQSAFDKMTEGTKLAGLVKIEYFIFSVSNWSEQFANGEYDLCFGAWGSAAFNPAYLLCETQISSDNRYAIGWDPTTVSVTVKATPDAKHEDGVYTYNLEQWRLILQGKEGCPVNFKNFPMDDQLAALGAVETAILQAYYSVPVFSRYSASLMGYKTDYISYEYNTFMGYGGIRYMSYNFDDAEWSAFVQSKGGELNYKFGK